MKKLILILFLLVLSGCNQSDAEVIIENDRNDFEVTEGGEFDSSKFSGGEVSFTYVDKFFSFKDLVDDEFAQFYYGEVTNIEEYNIFVDALYFDVIMSENNDIIGEIIIYVERHQETLEVGDEAILHVVYVESNSYYSLSSPYKSVFMVIGDSVYYSDDFDDLYDEIKQSKEKFLKKLFK